MRGAPEPSSGPLRVSRGKFSQIGATKSMRTTVAKEVSVRNGDEEKGLQLLSEAWKEQCNAPRARPEPSRP